MQIRRVFRKETYIVEDFEKRRFPISYDEKVFPNGFSSIKICYEDDEISGISLHSADDSMIVKKIDNDKIICLIRDSLADII